MTDELIKVAEGGGSVALIFAILLIFTWRYFTNDIKRVRSTGKGIIAEKDEKITEKDELITTKDEKHALEIKELNKEHLEHVKSLVRAHKEEIKEKDREIKEQAQSLQEWLIKDVEVKSQMAQAVESLSKIIDAKL